MALRGCSSFLRGYTVNFQQAVFNKRFLTGNSQHESYLLLTIILYKTIMVSIKTNRRLGYAKEFYEKAEGFLSCLESYE